MADKMTATTISPIQVLVPVLGESITEATLLQWLKSAGEAVRRGEVLAELETEKATVELECPANGVLLEILVKPGSTIIPGQLLATIERPGAPAGASRPARPTEAPEAAIIGKEPAGQPEGAAPPARPGKAPDRADQRIQAGQETPTQTGRRRISPAARRMAKSLNVDIESIAPAKPGARLTIADIERHLQAPAELLFRQPAGRLPHRRLELNAIRKTLATKMLESAQQIPQFSVAVDIQADRLLEVNEELAAKGLDISLTALLIFSVARTIRNHPLLNARFDQDAILVYETVNLAIAAATPQGLVAPVIHAAEKLSLVEISNKLKELVASARAGRMSLDQVTDATFTLSNLGMYGISQFVPLVNPPQAAILGVGAARPTVLPTSQGTRHVHIMTLTVSADHRVLDGETVARFLSDLRNDLETLQSERTIQINGK